MEPAKPLEARDAKWRGWQMPDHAPLWREVDTDCFNHSLDPFVFGAPAGLDSALRPRM